MFTLPKKSQHMSQRKVATQRFLQSVLLMSTAINTANMTDPEHPEARNIKGYLSKKAFR